MTHGFSKHPIALAVLTVAASLVLIAAPIRA